MEILDTVADVSCGVCGLSHEHDCCDMCGAREEVDPNHGTVNFFDSRGDRRASWEDACDCYDTVHGFPKVETTGECSECGSLQKIRHNHDIPHEYSEGVCEKYFCEEFWEHETGDECGVCECGLENPNEHLDSEIEEVELEPKACAICSRELKTERARKLGIGPICEKKFDLKTLGVLSKPSEDDLERLVSDYDFVWTTDDIYFAIDRPPYMSSIKKVMDTSTVVPYQRDYLLDKIQVRHWAKLESIGKLIWKTPKPTQGTTRNEVLEKICTGSYELGNLKVCKELKEEMLDVCRENWDLYLGEDGFLEDYSLLMNDLFNQMGLGEKQIFLRDRLEEVFLRVIKPEKAPFQVFDEVDYYWHGIFDIGVIGYNMEYARTNRTAGGLTNPDFALAMMEEGQDPYECMERALLIDSELVENFGELEMYDDSELYRPPSLADFIELYESLQ